MPKDELPTQKSPVATVDEIRSHFPALKRIQNGNPVAYFDGPGGTQVPVQVVEAINDYLYNHNANTHWEYPTSNETDDIIAAARATFGDFFNAKPNEVVFGHNMTTLTFHLCRALGRQLQAGDEVIVTELDHHANSDTWRALAQDRDLTIRILPMNGETGQLELDKLSGLLNARTKVVAIGAASNILGTVNPVSEIVSMAREAGAITFVDAVHYAAHELIDVKEMGCDFLAVSAYKFYGPHVGVLFGREELLESIDFPKLRPAPDYAPERMETGTQNHEGIAGAAAAVDFLASLARGGSRRERLASVFDELHRRQQEMFGLLWEELARLDKVRLFGPGPDSPRTSTLSFTVDGLDSAGVARRLATRGLFLSDGDFYALSVVEKFAAGNFVRAGLACYSTREEVERLVRTVEEIASR